MGERRVLRDLPGEAAVDGSLVDELVEWLGVHCAASTLALKLAIGDELLVRLFTRPAAEAPDIQAWARCGDQHKTYRALAEDPRCPRSRSYLGRCVRLSVQHRQLPPATARRLDLEKSELLVPIPMPAKARLAQLAVDGGWSRRRLDEEVAVWLRENRPLRPGRPRTSRAAKAVSSVTREARRGALLDDGDFPLRWERRHELAREIDVAIAELRSLAQRLRGGGGW